MSWGTSKKTGQIVAVFRALQGPAATATPTATASPTALPSALPGWDSAYYSYESDHPHAVVEIVRPAATDVFDYDAIGDMTSRTEVGMSWSQPFNEEGRLAGVTDTGTQDAWEFSYDGDGVRLMQDNPDGTTTLFLGGGSYEVTLNGQGQEAGVRRYYALGGQRVLREDTATYYLLTDHLGSVVGVADGSGSLVSSQRYLPYGLPRLTPGISQTGFSFTGQWALGTTGLIDYQARWYAPGGSRFLSPDPIVHGPLISGALTRHGYVRGNPISRIDPTGNYTCSDMDCRTRPAFYIWSVATTAGLHEQRDGRIAWHALEQIVYEKDAWWGDIGVLEAVGLMIYQEFSGIGRKPIAAEAMTRKYHQFCGDGPWSAECLNGYWGYMEAWRRMHDLLGRYKLLNLHDSENSYMLDDAREILNPTAHPEWAFGQLGDRPSHWVVLSYEHNRRTIEEIESHPSRYTFSHTTVGRGLEIMLSPNQFDGLCVEMTGAAGCRLLEAP